MRRTFIVDLTAPSVTIDSRLDGEQRPGVAIPLEFSAGENGVAFSCSLDGAAPEPCSPGWSMTPVRLGAHDVRVEGVDLAGNASSPSDPAAVRRFVVAAAPAAPTAPAAAPAPAPGRRAGGARRVGPRSATAGAQTRARSGRPRRSTMHVVRTAGLRLAPGARPVVNVLFDATPGARFARLTLRDFEGGGQVRVLARSDLRVSPGERVRMMWPLSGRQARRLHAGRYRLTVAMGPRRSELTTVWTGLLRVRPGDLRDAAHRPMRAAAMRVRPLTIVVPLLLAVLVAATFGIALTVLREDEPAPALDADEARSPLRRRRRNRGRSRSRSRSPRRRRPARSSPRTLWRSSSRHVLTDAGTAGRFVGLDLDAVKPSAADVRRTPRTGSLDGVMQPDLLRGAAARRVAAYVARVAGRSLVAARCASSRTRCARERSFCDGPHVGSL